MQELPRYSVRAVVFDKDGVLADSEAINIQSAFTVFREHGYELTPDDEPAIVGKHPKDYVPILGARFDMTPARQQQIIDEQDAIYTRLWHEHGCLIDGARDTLEAVRTMGYPVGLATSSSRAEVEGFLDRFDLRAMFDVTRTLDDVTRSKPDPEMYLSAAEALSVAPGDMLVVEDSEHGVRAATDAGAICVAVASRHVHPERVAGAARRIDRIRDLPGMLEPRPRSDRPRSG